jgi:hypothetical protein
MTDAEFVEELATRLNLLIEADSNRAQAVLTMPLLQAGYANVGHFLGQMCCPRGITDQTAPKDLQDVKFLMPVLDGERIARFRSVTGSELQQKAAEAAQKRADAAAAKDPGDPKIH